jgi:cephalosporin-C deacetylase
MALVDLPLAKLKKYKPEQNLEYDFEIFWQDKIETLKSKPIEYKIEKIDYFVPEIDAYKVIYKGYKDSPIYGYYLTPKKDSGFPIILKFHGYSGHKDPISLNIRWPLMGYAVFAIDVRGQSGESIDNSYYTGPSLPGYMTKGIFNKNEYYYLGVYLDCIRAIDFLSDREELDMRRLCITGGSQGGGLSLAAAGLDDRPKLVIAEIPYLCHFRRAVEWADEIKNLTYLEIANLIREYPEKENEIFKTLSYFDNLNLCNNIKAETIITCALKDVVCPPSTIFAVYNHIKSKKDIFLLPYSEHNYKSILRFDEKRVEYIRKRL